MTRGQPVVEALLESGLPYASGPEWLAREVLQDRWVLAVAGTHGKTTTTLAAGLDPRACGSQPRLPDRRGSREFRRSARASAATPFFVIEADEYDTAFFDKRAKFVHYRPRTLILNNLEFDHADIYADLAAIQRQFHHLVRTVPGGGRIVWNAADPALQGDARDGLLDTARGFRARAAAGRALDGAGERGSVSGVDRHPRARAGQ